MSQHIAIDIGGTQIRAALYDAASNLPITLERIPTQGQNQPPLERLKNLIALVLEQSSGVEAIGMAAPGPLDPFTGVMFAAPNIPGWVDLPLRGLIEERFGIPVALGNDANLAALGEWHFGAGQGHHHLIYITVSTGIGGGIIIDDRLLLGKNGLAAELGHISVMPDGPLCGCGHRGHLEAVASGTAISRWVQDKINQGAQTTLPAGQPISGRMISQAASEGDTLARAALDRAGRFIGHAIASFLHIFNPSCIIIGGGVSRSGDLLLQPMCEEMKQSVLSPHYLDGLTLTTAALGDEAGLMGALALARSYSR